MFARHILIRQFNRFTLLLLSAVFVFSCIWTSFSNQALIQDASIKRAGYIAGAIADSLTHALEVGVPLRELRDVNVLLRARTNENSDIGHISVLDLSGEVLWQAKGAKVGKTEMTITKDVRFQDKVVARVQASVYESSLMTSLLNTVLLQAMLCFIAYVACHEAIVFSLGRGVILRERAREKMQQYILQGKLDTVVVGQNRVMLDPVLYGMVQRLRRINETIWRIRRLTLSLRNTEPDAALRAQLDANLAGAEDQLLFADRKPAVETLTSTAIDARWLFFITCVTVEGAIQAMVPDKELWLSPLLVLSGAVGAIIGLFAGYRLASRSNSYTLAIIGAGIIAAGLLVVWIKPLTLYSVLARVLTYMGSMILLYGCYGAVAQTETARHQWVVAATAAGVFVGRLFSLLALEWFGGNNLVACLFLLILVVILLSNKFSWNTLGIWRRPIGNMEHGWREFSPLSFCNGILSGLIFSFALAHFVFLEGYGNEVMVTVSWFLLGLGAWIGYQLPPRWAKVLWGLALISTLLQALAPLSADMLGFIFCFSVSALEWHTRQHARPGTWLFTLSDLVGVVFGAALYMLVLYYQPLFDVAYAFIGSITLLGMVSVAIHRHRKHRGKA